MRRTLSASWYKGERAGADQDRTEGEKEEAEEAEEAKAGTTVEPCARLTPS